MHEKLRNIKILLIIPAYNEEKNLPDLLQRIEEYTSWLDLIVINDGSKDNTIDVLRDFNIEFIDLSVNLGIGGAVQAGYRYAEKNGYDIAIQFDGDGQHPHQDIVSLVEEILNGSDMVIGSRYIEKEGFQSTILRRLGIRCLSFLIKILTGKSISDPTSGFRACNRNIIKYFAEYYPQDYPEPETIVQLMRSKWTINEIPVRMVTRQKGVSSINLLKSIYYMFKVTLSIIIGVTDGKGGGLKKYG